jgi:CBS domain-containing protein
MPTKKSRTKKSTEAVACMTVKDVMEKRVQFARLNTKGDVIASFMIKGFGAVPVVNGGQRLAGIVSEHDLLGSHR